MTRKEIGQTLKKLREGAGLTREQVAAILDKSVKTIGHWESGYATPDANNQGVRGSNPRWVTTKEPSIYAIFKRFC